MEKERIFKMSGFKLTKELLDKRICDVDTNSSNTETYREFIHKAEKHLGLSTPTTDEMLDKAIDTDLNRYFKDLSGALDK
ncbi:hypothetical protein CLOHIR_00342 [Peptacetobacter hiranonis DSM 13275]|uniref:Uncharacterized protein n=2 Tax=Peptacetobacter TaxID=2743582 RepID=B6FWU3_PEPHT|nr:hypothetical protein CLOHIR_00342 [Peptacetobacter hiranonis DSM 13275]